MVKAVDFAVRTSAGRILHGQVAGDGGSPFIQVGAGEAVSLNLSPAQVAGYRRAGANLLVQTTDGREIVLDGFFEAAGSPANRLYLSSDGQITQVYLSDGTGGVVYASYGPAEGWSKFSALDELRFDNGTAVAVAEGGAVDERVGMAPFVPLLAGVGGGLGTAAAVVGGAVVVGGFAGGGGGGGGGGGPRQPTVDEPNAEHTLTTKTPDPAVVVSGTGEPGSTVVVTVGNGTGSTTIGGGGTWQVTLPDVPQDGTHEAVVVVTSKDGKTTETLDGPTFVIDMTPPEVALTEGTESVGHVENAADHQNGVTIGGTGEAGATIRVTVGTAVATTTVSTAGTWSVTYSTTHLPAGEYTAPVTVVATDALGNTTTITDRVVIDTVPHPLTIAPVTADNIVNAAEAAAGFSISGTSTSGATITVTLAGTTRTATVGADGTWTVGWSAGSLAAGEYDATITATTTDPAGNPSSTTRTMRVDTVTSVTLNGPIAGDDVVNATEVAGGVTLTGTAQPGSTVMVAWGGGNQPATVGADGSWSATFGAGQIAGGTYGSTVTVTATDAAGNTATTTRAVQVDTVTSVAVNPGQAGGDNILSGAERPGGLTLTGTAEAGAIVAVTFDGITRTVTAGGNGAWQANWSAGEVRAGTYSSTVQVTATDAAGNTAATSHVIAVDTEVTNFHRLSLSTGTDDILNKAEAASGLVVTGTVEPGSTVVVRFGSGATRTASVAADGTWTVTVPPADIPAGENTVTLTLTATDRVGNTASLTETVRVDTVVTPFALTGGPIGGDGILNAVEVAAGLTLTGTAEAGSTLVLTLSNGATQTVTTGPSGTWTASFAAGSLPQGEQAAHVTVTATDLAGNSATLTQGFAVDTIAPGAPEVVSFSRDANGLRGIGAEASPDVYDFVRIDAAGNQSTIGAVRTDDTVFNETNFRFTQTVPDGSYLVINTADAAGNQSSTLLVVDNTNAPTVNLSRAGLSGFDFTAIDLTFAPDAQMSITEAQIVGLTGPDNILTVKGGADDQVTLTGASATGQSQVIDGQTYAVYTLGSATVLLDDDIRTVL